MFVKICGITNEDDALLSVAMGADAVGFIFAPSTRQVAAQVVYDITRRLPAEILTVGVFRNEHPKLVVDTAHRAGVKAVQLSGRETPAQTIEVAKHFRWVIKAFGADDENLPRADQYGTDMIMMDAPEPGPARCSTGRWPGRRRLGQADPRRGLDAGERRRRDHRGAAVGCRRRHRASRSRRARRTRSP
jgi:phosphoribosylanthranilate isomerase